MAGRLVCDAVIGNSQVKTAEAGSRAGQDLRRPALPRPALPRPALPCARRPAGATAMAAALRRHWLAAALLGSYCLALRSSPSSRTARRCSTSIRGTCTTRTAWIPSATGAAAGDPARLDPDTVVAVQHLLGLAIAVVIYLRCCGAALRAGWPRWPSAPILLDAYQLQTEQSIMPGTWFEALIVAGLAILLWQPKASWRRRVAAGVVLGIRPPSPRWAKSRSCPR